MSDHEELTNEEEPTKTRIVAMSPDEYLDHLRQVLSEAKAEVVLVNVDYDAMLSADWNEKQGFITRTMAFGLPFNLVDLGVDMLTDITGLPEYQISYADGVRDQAMRHMNEVIDASPLMGPAIFHDPDTAPAGITSIPGIELPDDIL